MHHYRRKVKQYFRNQKADEGQPCQFCSLEAMRPQLVHEYEHCYVVNNRLHYDLWEGRDVVDQLMLIPKRHVRGLFELNDDEKLEIVKLMGHYEERDYNVYARSVASSSRSIEHQHTNLIKTKHRRPWLFLFISKPYFLFKR